MNLLKFLWILAVLSLPAFSSLTYSATSIRFSPLLLGLERIGRAQGSLDLWGSPSAELAFGYSHKIVDGFDVGLGLHGGVWGSDVASGILGSDIMARYVRAINQKVFLGAQLQSGIVYSGLGDQSIMVNYGFAFPITAGIVIGGVLQDNTQIYFFPSAEVGRTANAGDPLWKNGIGLMFALGAAVNLTEKTIVYIEAQPVINNLTGSEHALKTFSIGLSLGCLYDI